MLTAYIHVITLILLSLFTNHGVVSMPRATQSISIPSSSIGTKRCILVHRYAPELVQGTKTAYIQASLHADELPGMLVAHHLIKLLDSADRSGQILENISIVPYANPIGLSQNLLGTHIGRFSLGTGVNFNREYMNIGEAVAGRIEGSLCDDADYNVKIIREAFIAVIENTVEGRDESEMKRILHKIACPCDVVIDLHCDSDAVLHMYTSDRLWPQLSDLAAELKSECNLLAPASGFDSFDEACSCPWAFLADRFPSYPIPMACEAVTVELRGESDVYDELAIADAKAIYRFLQRRGYIRGTDLGSAPPAKILREASPLSGVDMVEASKVGIMAWRVQPGDVVSKGSVLGEIVDIEDPDQLREPVVSRTSGVVFSMARHKLVRPGQVIIKVAGEEELEWRVGNLLTSK